MDKASSNTQDTNKQSEDHRPISVRIAELKKPDVVDQPDEGKLQATLAAINDKIKKCDKRLIEIKAALERGAPRADRSESLRIIEQLKDVRIRIQQSSQEREHVTLQLRDLKFAREAQLKHLSDMRKSLRYDNTQQVDEKIRELEKRITDGQFSDIKEEKRVVMEIRQLSQMKSLIEQYNLQRQSFGDDPQVREQLERKRADASEKLEAARKEAENLEKSLEAARGNKKPAEAGPSKGELWKEQKSIYAEIKELRAEIRKINDDFREELNKYRDYQRAEANYNRQVQKIQGDQRRAEWEARRRDAERPVDADVPSDDPLVGHPWAEEILQCADLEKMLLSLLPKESVGSKEDESEKAWLKGAAGKMSGNEGSDPYAEARVIKKNKGARKALDASAVRLVLTMHTVSGLSSVGLPIPVTAADVPGCIEKLQAKRAAYTAMTEADKREAKARSSAAKSKGFSAGDGVIRELVAVEVECTAPDRVSVKLVFPALST